MASTKDSTADFQVQLQRASDYLAATDPAFQPVITAAGLPTFQPHERYFDELVRAIVSQQVSSKAAQAIYGRVLELYGGHLPSPAELAAADPEHLRLAGVSGVKARYIHDLASRASDGRLQLDRLPAMSDAAVTKELTAVKGIGIWTAQVFMLFCLGRLDILVPGDLGIRNGVKLVCGMEALPTPAEVEDIARQRHWSPYQSVACWYLWRMLDSDLGLYDKR